MCIFRREMFKDTHVHFKNKYSRIPMCSFSTELVKDTRVHFKNKY